MKDETDGVSLSYSVDLSERKEEYSTIDNMIGGITFV